MKSVITNVLAILLVAILGTAFITLCAFISGKAIQKMHASVRMSNMKAVLPHDRYIKYPIVDKKLDKHSINVAGETLFLCDKNNQQELLPIKRIDNDTVLAGFTMEDIKNISAAANADTLIAREFLNAHCIVNNGTVFHTVNSTSDIYYTDEDNKESRHYRIGVLFHLQSTNKRSASFRTHLLD